MWPRWRPQGGACATHGLAASIHLSSGGNLAEFATRGLFITEACWATICCQYYELPKHVISQTDEHSIFQLLLPSRSHLLDIPSHLFLWRKQFAYFKVTRTTPRCGSSKFISNNTQEYSIPKHNLTIWLFKWYIATISRCSVWSLYGVVSGDFYCFLCQIICLIGASNS